MVHGPNLACRRYLCVKLCWRGQARGARLPPLCRAELSGQHRGRVAREAGIDHLGLSEEVCWSVF